MQTCAHLPQDPFYLSLFLCVSWNKWDTGKWALEQSHSTYLAQFVKWILIYLCACYLFIHVPYTDADTQQTLILGYNHKT